LLEYHIGNSILTRPFERAGFVDAVLELVWGREGEPVRGRERGIVFREVRQVVGARGKEYFCKEGRLVVV
jgi:hypothetical protein